jgi:hypothetical protein|tara:strand:+ start:3635 stop:3817 length:183 start_codon:yes stop_codon:yes gene_type:complete
MKHKDKVKLARKLRTREESKKKNRVSIWNTIGWTSRKKAIFERVERRKNKIRYEVMDNER